MTEPTTQPTEPTTPANPATPPSTEVPAKVTFTPEQQAAIDALIGSARKEGKAAAERAAQEAKDAADAARTRADQEAKGQYEAAKQALEGERDTAKRERDELAQRVEKYEGIAKKQVEALKGDLPGEATEDFPADADPVTQLEWLESRKALIAKLAPATQGTGHPRVPPTPQPQGRANPTEQQMADRMRSSISI